MAPTTFTPADKLQPVTDTSANDDCDWQKWLKEVEGAESLMDQIEARTDSLQLKVDALLDEVVAPLPPPATEAQNDAQPSTEDCNDKQPSKANE
ncbi:hypothetical protein LRAMOSA09255 [Lichtheimia ramosa]|uniref:Uncharacterized protein n=1 Tax=Lichtheimia ramosa TaxID=688394 RepID=A0A077WI47_9FUNG|nr:hypothetical protein LRAMOSA09255 [Lichtheimia ramosa]